MCYIAHTENPRLDKNAIFNVRLVQRQMQIINSDKTKPLDLFHADQKRLLDLMALDAPLNETLNALLRMIEAYSDDGLLASILLVDESGTHLRLGAAPSLPDSYNLAIDGIAIGHGIGSCGTAAFLKKPVHVSNIADDPLWKDFRELAMRHSLQACWSTPICSANDEVVGTFAMYYPHTHGPQESDLKLVEIATRTAAIAIERHRVQKILRNSEERYRLINRATNDIIWDWDIGNDTVSWNDAAPAELGYSKEELGGHSAQWGEKSIRTTASA